MHMDKQKDSEILVRVENLGKLFCRDLKRSLAYGLLDGLNDLVPFGVRKYQSDGDPVMRKGEFWANRGVSFELRRGECIGLIGHNGAGKTTLLKMLNGLIRPDVGRIEMRGRVGALIALGAGFNPILTGRENVYIAGSVLGLSKKEIDARYDEIVAFSELEKFMESPVQNYSSGMQVRLGFAVASAMKPDVLLLDEVLAVGDAGFQAKCFNTLAKLRKEGVPFILVSHNMHHIARYCHRVLYLRQGQPEFLGDVDEGIKYFLNDMGEPSDGSEPDWSVVHGNGQIMFVNGEFQNSLGKAVTSVGVGEPFSLVLRYKTRNHRDGDVAFNFSVRSRGEQLYDYSTLRGDCRNAFRSLPSEGLIRVSIPGFLFNVDSLEFYFSIMNSRTNEIYDWKRDLRLNITNDGKGSLPGQLGVNVNVESIQE